MPNQITGVTPLGDLFTCIKFQCNSKSKPELCHFFKNVPKIEDFKNFTHFLITFFFSTSVSSDLNKAKDHKEQQIEPTNACQP